MGSYSQETLDALAALEAIFGPPDEDGPPKWSFEALFAHLAACGVPREIIWRQICHIMNLAIIPIITSATFTQKCNIFEFYGVGKRFSCSTFPLGLKAPRPFPPLKPDVLIDGSNKVWLLEVNQNPSIDLSFPLDKAIKIVSTFPLSLGGFFFTMVTPISCARDIANDYDNDGHSPQITPGSACGWLRINI